MVLEALKLFLFLKSDVNVSYIHDIHYCETSERLFKNGNGLAQRQLLLEIHYRTHQKSTDENIQETVKALSWEELDNNLPTLNLFQNA